MVGDYEQAACNGKIAMDKARSITMVGWTPPKEGYVKLNTDGACKNQQIAGCGGIIRGSQGEWIVSFAKYIGKSSAFVAEMWGVVEGLRLAKRMGFRKVELNVDSETVVNAIRSGKLCSSVGVALAKEIRRLMAGEWVVEVSNIYREANRCANALAKEG
ncbi:ribonuclease H protein, partial [Trifolium medium]|nr:ribonuclease H protein [Trifolium medium]